MPATRDAAGSRLLTANPADRVALRGVRLTARLAGMSQRTIIEQTFVNLEDRAIEAVYTFPLPETAAVCGFEVLTADRILTGAIEENDRAIERYENAVSEGHGAFAMEQVRADVFSVRVGNIKPRQMATIRLTYVAPLEFLDRQVRVAFPTTVAPRYVTNSGTNDPIATAVDGDALNPPHALAVPYCLSAQIDVAVGRPITSITCPSHPMRTEDLGNGEQRISFASGPAEMDRDVVLNINLRREPMPTVQTGRHPSTGDAFLAVTFIPEFDPAKLEKSAPCETVFILDCSGSMQGASTRQAVAALGLCLRSLSEGDAFNICRFGSTYELLSTDPLIYDENTLAKALKYIDRDADLGGTELHGPLEAILSTPIRVGKVRQIIVLTDGQVSNEPALLALARKHRAGNRIFTFGIGSASSATLVRGLARASGGAAEFISAGERIDDKVLRTFSRIASPPVTDVRIDWHGADVQTLSELPLLFDGDLLTVYARALGRAPAGVTLHCQTPSGPRQWSLEVPPPLDDAGLIALMWARRAMQSLEEVNNLTRLSSAERKLHKDAQALISLSKEFSLLSSLTTFIAIEHRTLAERNEGAPELRRVPVLLAHGWGGLDEALEVGTGMAFCLAAAVAPPLDAARRYPSAVAGAGAAAGGIFKSLRGLLGRRAEAKADFDTASELEDVQTRASLDAGPPAADERFILSLQSAKGDFRWDDCLNALLWPPRSSHTEYEAIIEQTLARTLPGQSIQVRPSLSSTVLVLVILRQRFCDRRDLWNRAYRKALTYLSGTLGCGIAIAEKWVEEVEQAILTDAAATKP